MADITQDEINKMKEAGYSEREIMEAAGYSNEEIVSALGEKTEQPINYYNEAASVLEPIARAPFKLAGTIADAVDYANPLNTNKGPIDRWGANKIGETISSIPNLWLGPEGEAPRTEVGKSIAGFGTAVENAALLGGASIPGGIKAALGGETARQVAESAGAGPVGSTVANIAGGLASTPTQTWQALKTIPELGKNAWNTTTKAIRDWRGRPNVEEAMAAIKNMAGGEAAVMGAASKNSEIGKAIFSDLANKEQEAFDNIRNHPELFEGITGPAAGDWTRSGQNFEVFKQRAQTLKGLSLQNRDAAYKGISEAEMAAIKRGEATGVSFNDIQNPSFTDEVGNVWNLDTLKRQLKTRLPNEPDPLELAKLDAQKAFGTEQSLIESRQINPYTKAEKNITNLTSKNFKDADIALSQLDATIADLGGYTVKGKLLPDGSMIQGADVENWANALKLYRGELQKKLSEYAKKLGANESEAIWSQADLDYRTGLKLYDLALNQEANAKQNISLSGGKSLLPNAGTEGSKIGKNITAAESLVTSSKSGLEKNMYAGIRRASDQMQVPLDLLAMLSQQKQAKMMAPLPRNLAEILGDSTATFKVGTLATMLGIAKDPQIMLSAPKAEAEEVLNQVINSFPNEFSPGPDNFSSAKNKDGKWYLTNPMEKDLLISDTIKSKNPAERAMTIGKLYEDSSFTPKETPTVEESPLPIDPLAAFNNLNNEPPTQNFTPNQSDSEIMLQQMNRHAQTYGQ